MDNEFRTLDDVNVTGKRVLVRADLNVPFESGRVTDANRIRRLLPTLSELMAKKARMIVLSHFDRPKGKFVPSMSLAPIADALSEELGSYVKFGVDCVGHAAENAVKGIGEGEVLLLENLRFHQGEEDNDAEFAKALASLGDVFVNDAFSCSHRKHASIYGITAYLPSVAGRLMQEELEALAAALLVPERPLTAIVGGAKVSTKLALLENLVSKVDALVIGGGMANTFMHAMGIPVGDSLCEKDLADTARKIMAKAEGSSCRIILPSDVVVAKTLSPHAPCRVIDPDKIMADEKILDIGPDTVSTIVAQLKNSKTLVWNGPLGAFETSPFDAATISVARRAAKLTLEGKLKTMAGGGDTVSAFRHSGLENQASYLSTAGGAFLEWLEGRELPGVAALAKAKKAA